MSNFRAVLTFAAVGALLGIVVATLVAPTFISNGLCGFSTDVQLQRPCLDTVQQATSRLIWDQVYGGAAGIVAGIASGIFFSVRRKKQAAADAPALSPKP